MILAFALNAQTKTKRSFTPGNKPLHLQN